MVLEFLAVFLPFWLLFGYLRPFLVPFEKEEVGVEAFLMESRSWFSLLSRTSILRSGFSVHFQIISWFCGVKWNSAFLNSNIEPLNWMKIKKWLQLKDMVSQILGSLNLLNMRFFSIQINIFSSLFLKGRRFLSEYPTVNYILFLFSLDLFSCFCNLHF